MSRQVLELETILEQLIGEHRKLLANAERQQAAMQAFRSEEMEDIAALQEATRLRITKMENNRRLLTSQIAMLYKTQGDLTLSRLAEMFPQRKSSLLVLRAELRGVMQQVQNRTQISSRLAGSVLGHLNTVVRLLAGAVERAGVYTKNGVPRVSSRIGSIEAVG
jgi:hypothetical protein